MENPNDTMTTPTPVSPREEGSVGPVVATIIILAVIVLGGLYFWSERGDRMSDDIYAPSATSTSLENSDDADSIEADLESTDINDADFEIQAS